MRNLLNFFVKYNHWLLFVLLEVVSLLLLFRFNNYQGSVSFTSAGRLAGECYRFVGNIDGYFGLRSANERLFEENVRLRQQIEELQGRQSARQSDTLALPGWGASSSPFSYIGARVVKNSTRLVRNWITIDRGTRHGVQPEMGVFNEQGVVGIVYLASSHYSLVIPILNELSSISCKLKGSDYFGSLQWEPGDPTVATLNDLPSHARVAPGDTVVTSGYSSIFPKDIEVGRVLSAEPSADGMFFCVKVQLAVDFARLTYLYVVDNRGAGEQKELEKRAQKEYK